ncbi:MAG: CinA family nicotinamide mononucleotide deamidase-related protein [Planctomycetota bacterium]
MADKKKPSRIHGSTPTRLTPEEGQYVAYVHLYRHLHRRGPSQAELASYFGATLPSVERMIANLEQKGVITRESETLGSMQTTLAPNEIPNLTSQVAATTRTLPPEDAPVTGGQIRAEVIAIGDELISGARLDTNSQWLSQQLEQLGLRVWFHATVGDELDPIIAAVHTAIERAHVVVLSGGLGPTADDLTRQALAAVVERPLVLNPRMLEHIRGLFARRGRVMPQQNTVQAMFPEGSEVIDNPHGTAPGIYLEVRTSGTKSARHVFALPGVPAELVQMWSEFVERRLSHLYAGHRRVIRHRVIRCFGAGESDIEQKLPDVVRRGRYPSVGITASRGTISLRITADGTSAEECHQAMEPTVAAIYQCLGTLIFGEEDDSLQDVVGRLLQKQHLELATAEWGTQGLLASWLAATVNNQRYLGGLVIGNEEALKHVVSPPTVGLADARNATRLVDAMASEVRNRFKTDLGLAVGPSPKQSLSPEDAPASIKLALATPDQTISASSSFAAHPAIRVQLAAKKALDLARLWLLKQAI